MAYLRIKSASLEDKEEAPDEPTVPPLLDEPYEELRDIVANCIDAQQTEYHARNYNPEDATYFFAPSSRKVGDWVIVSSVHRNLSTQTQSASIEEEVTECFHILRGS